MAAHGDSVDLIIVLRGPQGQSAISRCSGRDVEWLSESWTIIFPYSIAVGHRSASYQLGLTGWPDAVSAVNHVNNAEIFSTPPFDDLKHA